VNGQMMTNDATATAQAAELAAHCQVPAQGTSAALAAAESGGGTLTDAARGMVAGYEVHRTLSTAAHPSASHSAMVRGFTSWESVAAAAAAAVARSAPVDAAMRLAATHAPVPYLGKWYERPVPTVKNNLGWAAAIGVMSAELAEHGADGITDMLDGPSGFWRMAGSDRWEWATPAGDPAAIGRLGFKYFPACWHIQEQLGAVSGLLAEAGVRGEGSWVSVTDASGSRLRADIEEGDYFNPGGARPRRRGCRSQVRPDRRAHPRVRSCCRAQGARERYVGHAARLAADRLLQLSPAAPRPAATGREQLR